MIAESKKEKMFLVLGGFFISNALLGELIGGKLVNFGPIDLGLFRFDERIMSIGIIPWPVVFLTTDLMNEYYGRSGVRKITFLTAGLIAYLFVMLYLAMLVPASNISPVSDQAFNAVFGQSLWIIVGSVVAFILSQLIDVAIFWMLRARTGKKMLWLRSTGSTLVSQLVDTMLIMGIGFLLPGKLNFDQYVNAVITGYVGKMLIAFALTPLIYLGHGIADRYLGRSAERFVEEAASESGGRV